MSLGRADCGSVPCSRRQLLPLLTENGVLTLQLLFSLSWSLGSCAFSGSFRTEICGGFLLGLSHLRASECVA